jgi:hypothetical protein
MTIDILTSRSGPADFGPGRRTPADRPRRKPSRKAQRRSPPVAHREPASMPHREFRIDMCEPSHR